MATCPCRPPSCIPRACSCGPSPQPPRASLGYCLFQAAWGSGYATEAAHALLRWAFDALDLNRVQAEADTRNLASARVLEKLGFVREGTLREDCIVDGDVSDSWVFGLLRRDWQPPEARSAPSEARACLGLGQRRLIQARTSSAMVVGAAAVVLARSSVSGS